LQSYVYCLLELRELRDGFRKGLEKRLQKKKVLATKAFFQVILSYVIFVL